mgnify:CR=1 FL=1
MPRILGLGFNPLTVYYCHRADGAGGPENASLAGLPAAYIVQQMADMRAGLRRSAEPKMRPPAAMLAIAKASTVAASVA